MRVSTVRTKQSLWLRASCSLLATAVLLASAHGCATTRAVELPAPYYPSYDYEPDDVGDGRGISIAVLEPDFEDEEGVGDPDRQFQANLKRALMAYFTENGFAVSGPFSSMDIMTFPEKEQADLVLQTTMVYGGAFAKLQREAHRSAWDGAVSYSYWVQGDCTLSGGIQFTLWEPLSEQRMWTKKVKVPGKTLDCSVEETKSLEYVQRVYANVGNRLLSNFFAKTMHYVQKYFHPDEVRLVREQSLELRERKVYD